jgi:hypothetical protein
MAANGIRYCPCGRLLHQADSVQSGRCLDCRMKDGTRVDAPAGGHPGYLKILEEMRDLHVRKAADYGRGADPFANVRASERFGVPAWVGVMVRANDKMERIQSFIANGSLKNESVEDSLLDLAAYALIALVIRRGEAAKGGDSHA